MAEYINFEAEVEFDSEKDDDNDEISSDSENSFIDDQEIGNEADFYRFQNVENDIEQVLADAEKQALVDIDQFDELSNLCDGSDDESLIDEFKESEVDLKKFEETLFPRVDDDEQKKIENQFCKAVLYAMRFDKENSKDVCTQQDFEKIIDKSAIEQIYQPEKFPFIIDLQAFMSLCYEMNMILSSYGYFLRVFELKKKFRHLSVKSKDNQKIVRQLSSCLIKKFKGFTIISIKHQKKQRKTFKSIDIIYKPIRKFEIESIFYFSDDL